MLSARAQALQPSLTLAIAAKARALRDQGQDICSLSAGEPDFDTPAFIREAAVRALAEGHTRYGPAAGEPALRAAIAAKLERENGVSAGSHQVLVTNGGKQALYNLFQVLLDPGDCVLLPSPYWLSYPEIAALAGATTVSVPSSAERGFHPDPAALEAAITPNCRLLVVNSPANPTGAVLSRAELEALAAMLRRHPRLAVVCDEIYEYLTAPGHSHHSLAALAPDLAERTFIVGGCAKGWAMTGWRIGWLAGNPEVIRAASALQSQSTSNVCTFAQYGALAAVAGPRDCVRAMAQLRSAPRPPQQGSGVDPRHHPPATGGSLLRLPGCERLRPRLDGALQPPPRRRGPGRGAGDGLRRRPLHPPVLRRLTCHD